jgi:bisphosphoglycerate-dependent phosphoglycerate mutase
MMIKSILLTAFFAITTLALNAQEKYEYAVVRYYLISGERYKIELSTEDKIEVVAEASSAQYGKWSRDYDNTSPALKWISENNWEPVQFTAPSSNNNSSYFFLRRKKAQ